MSAETQKGPLDHRAWSVAHLVLAPTFLLGGAALDCWAAEHVWVWFVEPTYGPFPGAPVFFGAWFIAHILARSAPLALEQPAISFLRALGWAFLRPPMTVATAWLVWKVLV